ncbi:Conserved oligomeric Golgi complex subunit 2 [Nowakowskiella sp. JEL0407]|nr:Conserved oligomeric Golgi complex subunit 2 [Nowakowskiella sp. JEL0407]
MDPAFDRSLFKDKNFRPVDYLAEKQHFALDSLRREFLLFLKDLKNELVELINQDYADFINLSKNLVGVDKMIADLRRPLDKVKADVDVIHTNLKRVISELDEKLEKRGSIREKKACLLLFLGIHESVSKIEEMLNITHHGDESFTSDETMDPPQDDGKLIERVAIEYNQLQFLVSRGKDTPFVSNIEWRITRIKDSITTSLSRALKQSYQQVLSTSTSVPYQTSLTQYLRTYLLIDKLSESCEIFRTTIMVPFLTKTITPTSLEFNPTLTPLILKTESGEFSPLRDMYHKVLEFVKECMVIVDVMKKVARGKGVDLLRDVVWKEIVEFVINNVGVIFMPGIPETFHQNYLISMEFVRDFETNCKSKKAVLQLRSHPSYVEFMKRWQLAVYFQIRFNEITAKLEGGLNSESMSVDNTKDQLRLNSSIALVESIKLCWDEKIYLYGLSHKFWKLTLQIITRYTMHLKSKIPVASATTTGESERDDLAGSTPKLNGNNGIGSPALPPRPLKSGGTKSGDEEAGEENTLKLCLYIYSDLVRVKKLVGQIYKDDIQPKLPASLNEHEGLFQDTINTTISFEDLYSDITTRITQILIQKCSEPLRMIKEIPAQYRSMNIEEPSKASGYVETIFKPMKKFMETVAEEQVDSQQVEEWKSTIVGIVQERFKREMEEMETRVVKTGETLKRFNRKKYNNAGAESETVESKIQRQILIDSDAFEREVAGL